MIRFLSYFLFAVAILSCKNSISTEENETNIQEVDTLVSTKVFLFDSLKAYEYGADNYGMKEYVMAFLKKGPNRDRDSVGSYDLLMAHLKNIERMADNGDLVLAGPFLNDGDLRGIYIFNVTTIEEAKKLTETDPAIKAGSLTMELVPWYGSAALMGLTEAHKKIAKTNF